MMIGRLDREESQRVARLRRDARARPHLNASSGTAKPASTGYMFRQTGQLAFSSRAALGDAIRRSIVRAEEFRAQQGVPVQHVKSGRPLTAHGAELLGVPWQQGTTQQGEE